MASRPFLFCRYGITIGEESLSAVAQYKLISELQGQPAAHGPKAEEEKNYDTLIMRPQRLVIDGHTTYFWSVGVTIKQRLRAKYDRANDTIDLELINDGSVRFNDFIAVPSLGVLAVDDRAGELHLGGKHRLSIGFVQLSERMRGPTPLLYLRPHRRKFGKLCAVGVCLVSNSRFNRTTHGLYLVFRKP